MGHPFISIGMPFFNARATLLEAVRSVFAQTRADWELLLVDDGSSDGSLAMARQIDDPRVRVFADGVNRGLAVRLNQIAVLARADYLLRMDADDLMHPLRLQRQVQFLEDHPGIALVDATVCTIDRNHEPLGIRAESPLNLCPTVVLKQGLLFHPAVAGRTQWFRQNPYDPVFVRAEDRELWMRTCTHSGFARLSELLLFYRESPRGHLSNYLRTAQTVRKILRLYGPPMVGRPATARLVAESHVKSLTYRIATRFGLQGRLIRARNRALQPHEAEAARRVIEVILRTPVPGLPAAQSRLPCEGRQVVDIPS